MRTDQHELPTPRTTLLARYVRVLVCARRAGIGAMRTCRPWSMRAAATVPLVNLRFRCSNCGSGLTDFVVTATEETGRPRRNRFLI